MWAGKSSREEGVEQMVVDQSCFAVRLIGTVEIRTSIAGCHWWIEYLFILA